MGFNSILSAELQNRLIHLNASNEGTWIFGNVSGANNAYQLNDTDVAGNTSLYVSEKKPSNLRGFVQHVDAGAGKWTGDTQFSIDYVGNGTVEAPHAFAFAAFRALLLRFIAFFFSVNRTERKSRADKIVLS